MDNIIKVLKVLDLGINDWFCYWSKFSFMLLVGKFWFIYLFSINIISKQHIKIKIKLNKINNIS